MREGKIVKRGIYSTHIHTLIDQIQIHIAVTLIQKMTICGIELGAYGHRRLMLSTKLEPIVTIKICCETSISYIVVLDILLLQAIISFSHTVCAHIYIHIYCVCVLTDCVQQQVPRLSVTPIAPGRYLNPGRRTAAQSPWTNSNFGLFTLHTFNNCRAVQAWSRRSARKCTKPLAVRLEWRYAQLLRDYCNLDSSRLLTTD